MKKRTALLVTTATAGALALGARALGERRSVALDQWAKSPDPTGGDPLSFPDGTELCIPTADGGELTGIDTGGTGSIVVLVHGYTGTRGHWGPVAHRLVERGHRVVAYEQRGHGGSTVGDSGFTMSALGNDMRGVLEHLDLRDVVIAGHSMGGMALQAYVGGHPESARARVRCAVLTSTAADPNPIPGLLKILAPTFLASPIVDRVMRDELKGAFGMRNVVGRPVVLSHLTAARETLLATSPTTRVGCFRLCQTFDLTNEVRSFDIPTLILSGTRDEVLAHEQSKALAEAIPHAKLHVFPEAGHMLPWERPDEVTELIAAAAGPVEPAATTDSVTTEPA